MGRGELLPVIKPLVDFLKPKSVLDYGCGKGNLVKALAENYPNIKVYGYDPSVEEFDKMPTDKVDLVICTDVLEHIPEDELPETISRIASLSQNVFFHLHHAKAVAVLPNGENAHCTILTPQQYANLFKNFFSTLNFLPGLNEVNTCCVTFALPQNIVANWELLLNGVTISYIENLNQLIQLIHSREEVIIFPIGVEGQMLLDLLRYVNLLDRIACIAVPQVNNGYEQRFFHGIPIIPFENLVHFRETALIIVAASEQFHVNIGVGLRRLGFKSSIFIRNDVHAQIKNEFQKLYASGQVLMWFMNHFDKQLDDLELRINEQNEVGTLNTQTFSKYRNAFRGKKIVLVASGPTSKYYTPIKDAIHIGVNFAWKNDKISLDYLFIQDAHDRERAKQFTKNVFDKIKHEIFIGKFTNSLDSNWIVFSEEYSSLSNNIYRYMLSKNSVGQPIFQDICQYSLVNFRSITFPALHFALFTHPAEIYLVGCDTTSGNGHFYDNADDSKKQSLSTKYTKVGYARMKMFANQYYPDTKIISINPVGLRGLFSDVYTEEYKASLAKNI